MKNCDIKIGTGVTLISGSDSYAYVVTDIIDYTKSGEPKTLLLNGAWCKSDKNGSWICSTTPKRGYTRLHNYEFTLKRTRKGTYTPDGKVGYNYIFGFCDEYRDPSF